MVYFIQACNVDGYIKIGYTTTHVRSGQLHTAHEALLLRMSIIQVSCPYPLKALGVTSGDPREERLIQGRFSHLRVRGEWYAPGLDLLAFIRDCTYLPR
jgi:hypothetical protein